MLRFRYRSCSIVPAVTRKAFLVRRVTGLFLCFAAVAFLVWRVALGPENFRDDPCFGEKAWNLPSQSRLDSFCNEPQHMQSDVFEGELPSCMDKAQFELAQVITVLRHGDRAPMLEIAGLGGMADFECGLAGKRWDVLEQVILRKLVGKNEKITYPLHPGKEGQQCRPAALTTKGFEQHYTLGELFRKQYIDSGLLSGSTDFSTSRDLFVRVTGASRCMQSAGAFLTGLNRATDAEVLTHPDMWFRAPPPQLVNRLHPVFAGKACEETVNRQREAVKHSPKYLETTMERFEPIMARMSQWLGRHREILPDITFLCDIIQDEHCHGKKEFCLPDRVTTSKARYPDRSECFSSAEVKEIVESCDEAFSLNYSLPYSRLVIQPLLEQIVLHMEDALGKVASEPSQVLMRRLLLFFGHDSTLVPLLVSLGVHDGQWPPLASRVTFELWRCVTLECHSHKVRLLYNGQPLQGALTNTMGFCNFLELQRLVKQRQHECLQDCNSDRTDNFP